MKALPAIVIIISLFSACTSGKLPYIENSYYKNPSFEYSFKLPFGWVQTDKLPEFLNSAIPNRSKQNVNFTLFNNDANGIMYFSSAGIVSDTTAMSNEQLQKALISLIEEKVESFNNQLSIANVNMNKSFKSGCFSPCPIATVDADFENEFFKLKTLEITHIYPCRVNDTCVLDAGLISLEEKFLDNIVVFKDTLRSLQKHREYAH